MNERLSRLQRLAELHRKQHGQAALQVRLAMACLLSAENAADQVEAQRCEARARCIHATGAGDREAWLVALAEAELAQIASRQARQQLEGARAALVDSQALEGAARMRHRQIDAVRETLARDASVAAAKAEQARTEEIARMMRSAASAQGEGAAEDLSSCCWSPGAVPGKEPYVKERTASLDAGLHM